MLGVINSNVCGMHHLICDDRGTKLRPHCRGHSVMTAVNLFTFPALCFLSRKQVQAFSWSHRELYRQRYGSQETAPVELRAWCINCHYITDWTFIMLVFFLGYLFIFCIFVRCLLRSTLLLPSSYCKISPLTFFCFIFFPFFFLSIKLFSPHFSFFCTAR